MLQHLPHVALSCHMALTLPRVTIETWCDNKKFCRKKIKKTKKVKFFFKKLEKLKNPESDTWRTVNDVNHFFSERPDW